MYEHETRNSLIPTWTKIIVYKLTRIKKSFEKSSRNTTTSNGGTPCASKNEYNDAKIKKYSTASASEQLICEETQREFNQ